MHLRYSCILLIATASSSLFAASQTFIPQGPAPLIAPILFDPAGPNMNQSGAIQSFAINPANPQNIYACSASGGVWSSNNFGASWTPLLDGQLNLSVQSIAFDPSDPTHQTLVVGTGITSSGIALTTPTTTLGGPNPTGLYYTTNGGSSWSSLGSTTLANQSVVNVLANGPNILAATYEFTNPQPTSGYGLFVSTDTGTTFNLSPSGGPNQLATGPVSSLVADPTNTTLYAAVAAQVTLQDTALYKSTDGGSTWQPVFGAAQSNNVITPFVQTMIKAATGPSGSIAAFVQPVNNTMAVFLSLDEGGTWTQLDTSSIDFLLNASPGKSSIAIDANDPTVVYVTGSTTSAAVNQGFPATVYRLKYTGSSTETTSLIVGTDGSASHADSRMSLSLPDGSLIVSSDGGIALRTNANGAGGVWQSLVGNNLGTLEAYGSAYDANHFLALTASQDNGICVQNTPNQLSATQHFPSDGFQVFVDDKSVSPISLYYFTSNDESARQMDNVGGTILTSQAVEFNPLLNGLGSPIVLNLKDPTWLAVNSPDADNVHSDLSIAHNAGGLQFNQTLAGKSTSSFIDFAYGTQDNLQALVACAPGDGLYFTTDAAVVNSLALLPAYATQSGNTSPQEVVFDPRSYQRFFATDSAKVYQTLNSGTSFTTLTQVPSNLAYVRSLEFISNNGVNAFLVGGYSSDPSLSTIAVADSDSLGNLSNWRLFGLGLPNVFVMDMTYSNKADALLAGTWGRGAWLMYDVTSNFASASTLQFGLANNDSTPDSSVLTGNRPLNKYGTGTLTITGSPTFTGLSTVFEGTMLVNGSIPGDVMVNSGGNLKGTGTIGGLVTIASGGLLAPGNPSGALTVGSLNLQPSSSTAFQLVPSPADASHLIVTGQATIDGDLILTQNSGFYAAPLTYTLVDAQGGTTGQFGSIAIISPYSGFAFDLNYLNDAVQLILKSHLPTSSLQGNDRIVANYLNTAGSGSLALNLLAHLPASELPRAVNSVSPTRNAISSFATAKMLFSLLNGISSRMDEKLLRPFAQPTPAAPKPSLPTLGADFNQLSLIASAQDQIPSGRLEQGVRQNEKNGLWAQGFADFGNQDAQSQVPSFDFTTYGVLLGYDRYMQKGWAGITAGYAHTSISADHSLGKSKVESAILSPYGTATFHHAYFEGALVGAYNRVDQKRHVRFQGFDCHAEASYDIWQLMPHVGIGYDFLWNSFILEPFLSFDFLTLWQEGYREKNCPTFGMKVKNHTSFILQSEAGLRFYQRWKKDWGECMIREKIAYVNQAPFGMGRVNAALIGIDSFFTVKSFKENQSLFAFDVAAILKGNSGFYGLLSIGGEAGSGYLSCEPQVRFGRLF